MGFRLILEFNLALLAKKKLWRLIQFPKSLLARVLKRRYHRTCSILQTTCSVATSFVWSSLMEAHPLLLLGIRRVVHSGYQIQVWNDPWIPTASTRPARPATLVVHPRMTVSDHTHGNPRRWNVGLLEQLVAHEDVYLIRSMAISQSHREYRYSWGYTKSGLYNVKSGYWVARNVLYHDPEMVMFEPNIIKLQAHAWKIKAPLKMKHLIWQMASWYLAVTGNLTRRHMRCDNYCPKYGVEDDTVNHAIFECSPALQAWAHASTPSCPDIFARSSVYTNLDYLF